MEPRFGEPQNGKRRRRLSRSSASTFASARPAPTAVVIQSMSLSRPATSLATIRSCISGQIRRCRLPHSERAARASPNPAEASLLGDAVGMIAEGFGNIESAPSIEPSIRSARSGRKNFKDQDFARAAKLPARAEIGPETAWLPTTTNTVSPVMAAAARITWRKFSSFIRARPWPNGAMSKIVTQGREVKVVSQEYKSEALAQRRGVNRQNRLAEPFSRKLACCSKQALKAAPTARPATSIATIRSETRLKRRRRPGVSASRRMASG